MEDPNIILKESCDEVEEEDEMKIENKLNKESIIVDEPTRDEYYEDNTLEIGKDIIAEKLEVSNPPIRKNSRPQISS